MLKPSSCQLQDAGDAPNNSIVPIMSMVLPRSVKFAWLVCVFLVCEAQISHASSHIALVIGNDDYPLAPLRNPVNDASAIHAKFKDMGYESILVKDADRLELEAALDKFSTLVPKADVAVVFYAGHAIQVDGKNYILPVDAKIQNKRDLRKLTLLDELTLEVSSAKGLGVVIIDACRDNPFGVKLATNANRSVVVSQGLSGAGVIGGNTLIAYATEEGAVAADGFDVHSPYTQSLLQHVDTANLDIRLMFGKVRDDVLLKTNGGQRPSVYGSLGGSNYYLGSEVSTTSRDTASVIFERLKYAIAAKDQAAIAEISEHSNTWSDYISYLMTNFESVELKLGDTRLSKKGTEARAELLVVEMSLKNGDKGYPNESMGKIVLRSQFNGRQWSKIQW